VDGLRSLRGHVTSHATIGVLIADAQPLFLDGLARAVRQDAQLQLRGELDDPRAALIAIRERLPDVALLDAAFGGLRVLAARRYEDWPTRVVLLDWDPSSALIYDALRAGAAGVMSKRSTAEQLRAAIRAAAAGGTALCEAAQRGLAAEIRVRDPDGRPRVTEREREVLRLMAEGCTAPTIARSLHLAPRTVRTHIEHLYERFGVAERAQLVACAMRAGVLQ
jgi:two-component system, NarL family, nitrate/nitrite response regulator NarL